jgi:hypothetical protein
MIFGNIYKSTSDVQSYDKIKRLNTLLWKRAF